MGGVKFYKQISPTIRANKVCTGVVLIKEQNDITGKNRRDVSSAGNDESEKQAEDP